LNLCFLQPQCDNHQQHQHMQSIHKNHAFNEMLRCILSAQTLCQCFNFWFKCMLVKQFMVCHLQLTITNKTKQLFNLIVVLQNLMQMQSTHRL
jgi:hypothetical protein